MALGGALAGSDAIAHHDLFGGFCVSYGDYPAKLLRPRFALIGETVAVIEAFRGWTAFTGRGPD